VNGTVVMSTIGVGRRFDTVESRLPALADVSLDIHAGEVLAVVGRSGSGKSTLLTILGALDRPDGGSVVMGDTTISDLPEAALTRLRRDRIGFVFQDAQLLDTMTVLENVALTAVVAGRRRAAWRERASSLLKELDLLHLADEMPSTLSGGEAQRVALARALFADPVLLLADEPTGALDSATSTTVLALLRRSVGPDSAVVVVTHDLETACVADRIVVLKDGRIVSDERFSLPVSSTDAERRAHEERVRAWLAEHR
jgi:ABC-type lipoprotein export system ATPase subunit